MSPHEYDQYFRYGRIDPPMFAPATIGGILGPQINPFGITQAPSQKRVSQSSEGSLVKVGRDRKLTPVPKGPVKNTGPVPGDPARPNPNSKNKRDAFNANWFSDLMKNLSVTANQLNEKKKQEEDPYSTGMNEGSGPTREDAEDAKMSTGNVGRSFRMKYPQYYRKEPGAVPSSFFYNGGNRLP